MQMYLPGADTANFEPILPWHPALTAPNAAGADQMRHLKALIESRPMLDRVPDPSLIVDNGRATTASSRAGARAMPSPTAIAGAPSRCGSVRFPAGRSAPPGIRRATGP